MPVTPPGPAGRSRAAPEDGHRGTSRLRVRSLLVPHGSARTTPDSRRIRKCRVMAEAASGVSIAPQACERPSDNCRTTDSLTGSASACRTVTRRMSPALG